MNIQIFFGQAVSQDSSKPLIVKGFYLLRMSNDYCFRWAAQRKLSERNKRNSATVLRAVVKFHNCLVGVLEEISKVFQNLQGRARAGVFYCKVAACNSL